MSQLITYNNINDGAAGRSYTAFPLNSTLVSSYTPDTIRSIINQAATGSPYTTSVWIRISRVGIQINAQDANIARTRKPVFIPVGIVHDIYMQPNINNVICIVYDELQSNMKGILLYVVSPTDAQLIRDDFRIVKQAQSAPQTAPATYSNGLDNRYTTTVDLYPEGQSQVYPPVSLRKSPSRQLSPRRAIFAREDDTSKTQDVTQTRYKSSKSSYHSAREDTDKQHRKGSRKTHHVQSPAEPSIERKSRHRRKYRSRSRSPEKPVKVKLSATNNIQEFTQEQINQQQQMVAWLSGQSAPLIPMGVYNRYIPKTIPLSTGETLTTTLPPPGLNGGATNGLGVAYIEPPHPVDTLTVRHSPNDVPLNLSGPPASKSTPAKADDTKRYLKALVTEMQSLKLEMNKMRRSAANTGRGRSDSIQLDLKQLRSDIDTIRARIAMTPKIPDK